MGGEFVRGAKERETMKSRLGWNDLNIGKAVSREVG